MVRVDDRLLHGQVALGWRGAVDPEAFLIVDDEAAADPFAATLFEAALPEGTRLLLLDSERFLNGADLEGPDRRRTLLLVRGLPELRHLCGGGFRPREVNLGGIHHRPGARRYLDYIFLTDQDVASVRWILSLGIVLFAQDLPSSPKRRMEELLRQGEPGA